MKLMIAKCCGEIVVPNSIKGRVRFCECKRSAVWWDDPFTGDLAVWHDVATPMPEVLGISNLFLTATMSRLGFVDKPTLHATCEKSGGFFKTLDSPIVRVLPTSKSIKGIRVTDVRPTIEEP